MGLHIGSAPECSKAGQVAHQDAARLLVLRASEAHAHQPAVGMVLLVFRIVQPLEADPRGRFGNPQHAFEQISIGRPAGWLILCKGYAECNTISRLKYR